MSATEQDFDELPEILRLALIDDARLRHLDKKTGHPLPLSPNRLADAVGADPIQYQRHCRIAFLKLQNQAADLGLELPDFQDPAEYPDS